MKIERVRRLGACEEPSACDFCYKPMELGYVFWLDEPLHVCDECLKKARQSPTKWLSNEK